MGRREIDDSDLAGVSGAGEVQDVGAEPGGSPTGQPKLPRDVGEVREPGTTPGTGGDEPPGTLERDP